MNEAEDTGGFFRCELHVDIAEERGPTKTQYSMDVRLYLWEVFLGTFLALVPLTIVGSLSGFAIRKSTSIQRGFTMSWLAIGMFHDVIESVLIFYTPESKLKIMGDIVICFLAYGVPPVAWLLWG
jgi:hypothetical protein